MPNACARCGHDLAAHLPVAPYTCQHTKADWRDFTITHGQRCTCAGYLIPPTPPAPNCARSGHAEKCCERGALGCICYEDDFDYGSLLEPLGLKHAEEQQLQPTPPMPTPEIDPKTARYVLAKCVAELSAQGDLSAAQFVREHSDRTYPRRMVGPEVDKYRVVMADGDAFVEMRDSDGVWEFYCDIPSPATRAALRDGLKEEE